MWRKNVKRQIKECHGQKNKKERGGNESVGRKMRRGKGGQGNDWKRRGGGGEKEKKCERKMKVLLL